jgi:hypothetical protein
LVLCDIGPGLGFEVIAKIGFVFLANLFRGRFLAMFRVRCVVFDTHLADMQLCVAGLADIESAQRKTKRSK